MIHEFPEDIRLDLPNWFTDPFRYTPHPLVRHAANRVISALDRRIREGLLPEEVCTGFKAGKMLGVLVCESGNPGKRPVFLAGFSGSVGGCSTIEGFVPPIFDLMDPEGYYKQQEEKISSLNDIINELQNASEFHDYKRMLWMAEGERESELMSMRERMAASKSDRDRRRAEGCDPEILIRESQHEKAEFKRLKVAWDKKLDHIKDELAGFQHQIDKRKKLRASMSDALQEWLFTSYKVHNFLGEESSILEIFSTQGLIPPGGTGECAAPKLLEHAYKMGLKPLAMGEFWYGKPSETAVRVHGHFYPSCTSKCGPLLGFMLQGLDLTPKQECKESPVILHEDEEIIIAVKPSGMPSVPGLDGRMSLEGWLRKGREVFAVHRLDMDTSGVMVFAKTASSAVELTRQFEAHSVSKTYCARLCNTSSAIPGAQAEKTVLPPWPQGSQAKSKRSGGPLQRAVQVLYQEMQKNGTIDLPITADYDERPRQKVDFAQGKPAITEYELRQTNSDGTAEIIFHPITGRTHQLRVHSAHALGLCSPIVGDMLYGGQCTAFQDSADPSPKRLHLHASSLSFTHPTTGESLTFSSDINKY